MQVIRNPDVRLALAGGICLAVGLATVVGWLLQEPLLVRLHPDWVPMRFNAALGVALAGLALLARARGWWGVVRALGIVVALIGLGTLLQFVLGIRLGLDEFLVRDFLAAAGDPPSLQDPGRMGPMGAAGLFLLGVAVLYRSRDRRSALLGALVAGSLCSMGVASLFAYLSGAVFLYDWGAGAYTAPTSLQAALCLVLAGWALLREFLDAGRGQPGVPAVWLPLPVLLAGLVMTSMVWEGLATQARHATRSLVDRELEAVQTILANRLQARWQALSVLTSELEGENPTAAWQGLAEGYYASSPGILNLEWAGPEGRIRWVYPPEAGPRLVGYDLRQEPVRAHGLEQARESRSLFVTPTVDLLEGGKGFLSYSPLFAAGRLEGFLVAAFRYQDLFQRVLRDLGSDYGVEIREAQESVYRFEPDGPEPAGWARERPVVLPGVTWTLRVWPTRDQLARLESPLPDFALAAGIALSVLLSLVALYAQRGAQRSWEALVGEELYRDLVENVRELICSHDETGRLLSVNRSIVRLFGTERDQLLGRCIQDLLTPRARKEFPQYLGEVLEKGRARGFMEVGLPDGSVRILEYDNTRGRDLQGRTVVRGVSRDVTERIRVEQEVAHLRRQQESILRSVQEGIYEIDLEGIARFVNPAACRMLGFMPEEFLGRNPHELMHHTRADGSPYPVEECPAFLALRDGVPRTADGECFWRRDGTSLAVEYSASPVVDAQGRVRGTVVAFRDVTERREIDRMKDEFISVVSHELRTPLTSIRGSLGLLAAGKLGALDPKGQRMLDIALSNAERLVRLINDILDLERMTSGQAPLQPEECSAHRLLVETSESVQATADVAGVRLVVEDGEDPTLRADPDRVVQALTNLAGNAVKFSTEGDVVTLRVRTDGPWVVFEVQDRGRGIPLEHQERIFERFQQVDGSDSRQKGGTGLGLAITRTIVESHGGRVELESAPGEGSLFRLRLPRIGP